MRAAPALRSVALMSAPRRFSTLRTRAVRLLTLMDAPILRSSFTWLNRFSKMFSTTTELEVPVVRYAIMGCCRSVGKPGYTAVLMFTPRGRWSIFTRR